MESWTDQNLESSTALRRKRTKNSMNLPRKRTRRKPTKTCGRELRNFKRRKLQKEKTSIAKENAELKRKIDLSGKTLIPC